MLWIRRYPIVVNLVLAFMVALLAGLWTNLYTSHSFQTPMPDREHLLLAGALLFIGIQCWYNQSISRTEKKIINALLDFGIRFFLANSEKELTTDALRVIVHLVEKTKPGPKLSLQRCLVPRYFKSPVAPRDIGAIPIEADSYKKWYVNVKAFTTQRVVCEEPTQTNRPASDGHYVSTPSLFPAKSVLSAPIWCRRQPSPYVVGTITFDSIYSAAELNWMKGDVVCAPACDMLNSLADLIGKILSDDNTTD